MKRPVQMFLLLVSGCGLLQVSLLTDLCLRYVRPGMRPLLVASGVLLLALGAAEAWSYLAPRLRPGAAARHGVPGSGGDRDDDSDGRDERDGRDWRDRREEPDGREEPEEPEEHEGHDHGHDHEHSGVPRVAWLLFLPALSLLLYAPPALGAYTASREPSRAVTRQDRFDALPATSPLPMTLTQFTRRVQQDRTQAIKGRTVRMSGLVTPDKGHGDWYLTRIIISCCAADAQSVKVRIHGAPPLAADTWVSVTGTVHPSGRLGTSSARAELDARTVTKTDRPANGYTDDLPLVPSR
ncbi:TIGR03943 family protein [Streptomyces sp. NPDC007084]|uniref:TIGR03943 family putative permease subunit n=1 Tax=Streptomyces sp. NPDC007084 TaxID=3154313 RepID=UPI003451EA91